MTVRKLLTTAVEVLLETVLPRKKHSAAARHFTVETIREKIRPTQNRGHGALLPYNNRSVKHFIHAIKYEKHKKSISIASEILWEYMYDEIQEQEALQKMHYALCTIPATQQRKTSNGYNHLHAVMHEIHKHLRNIQFEIQDKRDLLCWTRHVSRQSRLKDRSERIRNVSGAMVTTERIPPNTICFVIDDVTTTGATLTEAGRALTAGGASTVITLALAH